MARIPNSSSKTFLYPRLQKVPIPYLETVVGQQQPALLVLGVGNA